MRRVALCIHDLRASEGEKILEILRFVRESFNADTVTAHIIFDIEPENCTSFLPLLKKEVKENRLEIVFHGVTHKCPRGTWKMLSWYHKYEAEYAGDSFDVEMNRTRFKSLNDMLETETGLCPSCWIASAQGWKFLKTLNPLYVEKLLMIVFRKKKVFSLPVSLATIRKWELFFLKIVASFITRISGICRNTSLRIVVHTIDLLNMESVIFLVNKYSDVIIKGYVPVLQRELLTGDKN
jgi:hypothetical protein